MTLIAAGVIPRHWFAASLATGQLFITLCSAQTAHTAATAPAFEVVSIKHFPDSARVRQTGLVNNSGRMQGNATMWYMLTSAYAVSSKRLIAPEWTINSTYEVAAIAPAEASKETRMQMLQTMLVERFGLKCHYEERQADIYALTVGSPPLKLIPATEEAPIDYSHTYRQFKQKSATLANLVFSLTPEMGREVVDLTGLQGKYTFDLDWKYAYQDPANIAHQPDGTGILDPIFITKALKSVGLKLEPRKMAMKYLVVERINKEPTAN